jgi:hypothetical protein
LITQNYSICKYAVVKEIQEKMRELLRKIKEVARLFRNVKIGP